MLALFLADLFQNSLKCLALLLRALLCAVQWTHTTNHLVNVLRALLWTAHREARGKALLNKLTQPILVYYGKKDKHRYTTHQPAA